MHTFSELFRSELQRARLQQRNLKPGECQTPDLRRCTLCHAIDLNYDDEVDIKSRALQKFWSNYFPGIHLEQLIPSPRGRGYRTTTKRKVFPARRSVALGLISPSDDGMLTPFAVTQCAIEPPAHARIYQFVQEKMTKPYAAPLAEQLSYVIVKGNYSEYTVIFSVREFSLRLVRAANTMSKALTHTLPNIIGVFLHQDASGGRYYLGSPNARAKQDFKKIFGKGDVFQRVLDRSFLHSPLSFSQVNESIVDTLVSTARSLLDLKASMQLYDLYCGYGLFALCLANNVRRVIGAEVSYSSVQSGRANARRQHVTNARFIQSDITEESIGRIMKEARPGDAVLLDPPRKGTASGVIEHIAAKHPARVLHIFCEIDLLPLEIKRWKQSGYTISRAVPLDMFPGAPLVEALVLLMPD